MIEKFLKDECRSQEIVGLSAQVAQLTRENAELKQLIESITT